MSFQSLDSKIRDLLTFNTKVLQRLEKIFDDFRVLNREFRSDFEKLVKQTSADGSKSITEQMANMTLKVVEDHFNPLSLLSIVGERNLDHNLAIVVFGANSSGKTSFIQRFLEIGSILPADIGPVTARIVQLSYASPEEASFSVYTTCDRERIQFSDNLSSYFRNLEEPDWDGIGRKLLPHVQRPSGMRTDSEEFKAWAKCFVKVNLPSAMLQLGIDVYDTPGFLSGNRDKELNKNLHELVKRIQPILLFLYENASIDETERNCFLGMKEAFNGLSSIPTFFLSTKADCSTLASDYSLDDDPSEVSDDKFQDALLKRRQKRYDLLRRRAEMANEFLGMLPNKVDQCEAFDIFTAPADPDPWEIFTKQINAESSRRIVRFAVDSNFMKFKGIVNDILSRVDDYFDLIASVTQRTANQWQDLFNEAEDWGKQFFQSFENLIPKLTDDFLHKINEIFEQEEKNIAIAAAKTERPSDDIIQKLLRDNRKAVSDYIDIAFQEMIIKVATNQVIERTSNEIKQNIKQHFQRQHNARRNELLELAQRQALGEINAQMLFCKKGFQCFLHSLWKIPMSIQRYWLSIPTFVTKQLKEKYAALSLNAAVSDDDKVFKYLDAMDAHASLADKDKRQIFAEHCLRKKVEQIKSDEHNFKKILTQWFRGQQHTFNSNLKQNSEYLISTASQKWILNDLVNTYSERFSVFECQLLAMQAWLEHGDQKPIIGKILGSGGLSNVYAAEWGEDKNLAVKKLRDSNPTHFLHFANEIHHHRILSRFEHVAPILSVYEDEGADEYNKFCIVMLKYRTSLQEHLRKNIATMSFDQSVGFAVPIAQILDQLHRCEFVHRDLKTSNVMIDDDEQCRLIDFGTTKFGNAQHDPTGSLPFSPETRALMEKKSHGTEYYDAAATDVYAFGCILYELFPKDDYKTLELSMTSNLQALFSSFRQSGSLTAEYEKLAILCLAENPKQRPSAAMILTKLKCIEKTVEAKPCTICSERDRSLRFKPCGHKSMCDVCWESWKKAQPASFCTICRKIVTYTVRDAVNDTYVQ